MPTFDFACESCGKVTSTLAGYEDRGEDCSCGGVTKRLFSPTAALKMARDADPQFDDLRAKHSAWYNSPETQGKLKRGELRHLTKAERLDGVH